MYVAIITDNSKHDKECNYLHFYCFSVKDVSVVNDKFIPMRIKPNGKVMWSPTGIFKVFINTPPIVSPIHWYPMSKLQYHPTKNEIFI